jgi:hypothetical protein
MKKVIFSIALFSALFITANNVSAGVVIFYSNGQKIDVVQKLPKEVIIDKKHVNLGVMYDQFAIFWIPLWNYGETKYVLINDKEDTYYDLDEEDLEMLRSEYDVKISEKPSIDFWNKIGGKLIGLVVLGFILFGYWAKRKVIVKGKAEDPEEEEEEEESPEEEQEEEE